MSFLSSLFSSPGYLRAEQEASDYCQTYAETTLAPPYVRTAIMDHWAAPIGFTAVGCLGTVFTLWVAKRVGPFKMVAPEGTKRRPKLAQSHPFLLLTAATVGSIGGSLAHVGQQKASHVNLANFLEKEAIPHMVDLEVRFHDLRSYKQMVTVLKEKLADEKEWIATNGKSPALIAKKKAEAEAMAKAMEALEAAKAKQKELEDKNQKK